MGEHCNNTGHSVSWDNTKVLTGEQDWLKRKVKEAIYIYILNSGDSLWAEAGGAGVLPTITPAANNLRTYYSADFGVFNA